MSKYLASSLLLVGLVLGTGIGYVLTPEYTRASEEGAHVSDLGRADKYIDLRFIDAMIVHHNGAIDMAKQAQVNSKREEIKSLSNNIVTVQQKEVDQLYQWKKDWFNDSKRVKDSEKTNLGSADDKFDLRFINAMIAHHEDAVMMAADIQQKSTRNEILNVANEIVTTQTTEISTMKDWRSNWYGISSGDGMDSTSEMQRLGAADSKLDLRYINMMASHHQGAILLAEQVKDKTQRQEIKDLAAMILEGEPKLIEELYTWKKNWYNDSTRAKSPIVAQLGNYDDKLDLRLLNALIAHHEAGVQMAEEAKTKSTRNEVLNNADAVEKFLSESAETLKGLREKWYGIKATPAQTINKTM